MRFLFLMLSLTSCSSLLVNQSKIIQISSTPPAKVFLIHGNSQGIEEFGITPVKLSQEQLEKYSRGKEWYFFKLETPGYVSENISVEKSSKISEIDVQLRAIEWWNDPTKQMASRVAHQIGTSVKEIYRNIRLGNIDEAFETVERLIQQYPSAAIFYDIQGSLFVLKNQPEMAISSFEKSIQMEPTNPETVALLQKLKKGN